MARSTVRNLLTESQKQGWLHVDVRGGHALTLSDEFVMICQRWVALEMVWTGELANAAAARLEAARN